MAALTTSPHACTTRPSSPTRTPWRQLRDQGHQRRCHHRAVHQGPQRHRRHRDEAGTLTPDVSMIVLSPIPGTPGQRTAEAARRRSRQHGRFVRDCAASGRQGGTVQPRRGSRRHRRDPPSAGAPRRPGGAAPTTRNPARTRRRCSAFARAPGRTTGPVCIQALPTSLPMPVTRHGQTAPAPVRAR
jgi:hypothetical protein